MKKNLLILLYLVFISFGCSPKKEKTVVSGPLKEIKTYRVIPLFFPNESTDKEVLFSHFVERLKQLGDVEITTNCITDIPASIALLCISVSEYENTKGGSIKVFAESEVVANGYKTSSDIWTTTFLDPTSAYPVIEENGISFRKDESSKSPDMEAVAVEMITEFAKQFKQDNPDSKPTFQIYKKIFEP